jgi:amidase
MSSTLPVPPKFTIDHNKIPLTSVANDYTPDSEKFERDWLPKVKAYNQALKDAIPKEYLAPKEMVPEDLDTIHFNATTVPETILDKETLEITNLTAVEIAKLIKKKELTAVEAVTAFFKRAVIAHQFTDCLLEIVYEEGLERAKYLDDLYEKTGKLIGPLHGVPISLKEHYDFEGHVTHAAFVSNIENVSPKYATTSQILYDLGAVFYVRTNQPQSLMHLDSLNSISARCKNAYNTSASPGGSSSGEGALIGMRGSPLGVGSDIGGSIRAPAAFNGIWGLKPSTKRISVKGAVSSHESTVPELVPASLGPMANSPEDLEFFMEAYLSKQPWEYDQHCVPIPWKTVPVPKPSELTIAIAYDDGVVKPHPPVVRALKEVAAKLKAAGVNVIEWQPHRVYEAIEIAFASYTADGNYAAIHKFAESGEPLQELTKYFLSVGHGSKGLTTLELEEYTCKREAIRQEYLELYNERGVDFIIAPTYVAAAPKPAAPKYWGYTALWNMMDATCVTFPSTVFGDKTVDLKDESYVPRNKYEEREYATYDPDFSDGMPVGLTLVGRRYTEETALKASKVVHDIMIAA